MLLRMVAPPDPGSGLTGVCAVEQPAAGHAIYGCAGRSGRGAMLHLMCARPEPISPLYIRSLLSPLFLLSSLFSPLSSLSLLLSSPLLYSALFSSPLLCEPPPPNLALFAAAKPMRCMPCAAVACPEQMCRWSGR